jgi:hypothetical protein
MRKLIDRWMLHFVRRLHKKAEIQLMEYKAKKLHGTPAYVKIAGQERKLRDMKKALQQKVAPPPEPPARRRQPSH